MLALWDSLSSSKEIGSEKVLPMWRFVSSAHRLISIGLERCRSVGFWYLDRELAIQTYIYGISLGDGDAF